MTSPTHTTTRTTIPSATLTSSATSLPTAVPTSTTAAPTPASTPTPGVRLVGDLVTYVPGLRTAYDAHLVAQGRVQPHVFFWDVVQATVHSFLADPLLPGRQGGADWQRTLDFLEAQSRLGVVGIDEVIITSFLGDLPHPHEPGHPLVRQLGPVMAARFHHLRPGG
ncbi:hypothetical protein ABZ990_06840 [Streptomyces sp. NPDC046203]|uniref:hypothetical protein n=1 Tax=Streptomyces sp. NPDC046203 TaxID=3154602 RepID=UPI0033DEF2F4